MLSIDRYLQTFSPDSRWLVASSLDSIIRTFDIPTGRLIDGFRTSSLATSIAFSPTNDFLATAHVDSVGVFLWWDFVLLATVYVKTDLSLLIQGQPGPICGRFFPNRGRR